MWQNKNKHLTGQFGFLASQNFVKFGNEKKKFYCIFDATNKENFYKDELHLIPTTAFFKRRVLFYTKITLKTPLRIKKRFQWTGIIPSLDRRNFQREIKSILKIENQKICRLSNLQ